MLRESLLMVESADGAASATGAGADAVSGSEVSGSGVGAEASSGC